VRILCHRHAQADGRPRRISRDGVTLAHNPVLTEHRRLALNWRAVPQPKIITQIQLIYRTVQCRDPLRWPLPRIV